MIPNVGIKMGNYSFLASPMVLGDSDIDLVLDMDWLSKHKAFLDFAAKEVKLTNPVEDIRIPEEDIPKTAFRMSFGSYEYTVMSFGLANSPPTFSRMMNFIFNPYTNEFVLKRKEKLQWVAKQQHSLPGPRPPDRHSRAAPLPAGATACACCELLCAASPHPRYGHRHHTRTPPAFAVHHTRPLASPPATGALAAIVACGSSHPPPPNLAACCSERATPRPPPPGRASSARPRRPRLSSVPPRLASAPPPEAAATSSPALARAAPAVASPAPPPPLRRPPAGSARTGRAPARARPTPTPASGAR
nr:formin-like protein 5 [Aegilops tauschii subsp. strangulata]